ncbi:MAG: hypothetical protein ACTHXA_00150 [Gulosibacter sp.]|uniref:hypothetical protein n=1 Tax=Gulosibacter sp. TaxID=2817531 RepID=UPI003F90FE38
MELFFAGIFSLLIGLAASFLVRPRTVMGSALIPGVGTAVGLAFWVVATWLLKIPAFSWLAYDRAVIWVLLVVIVAAVVVPMAFTLPRQRVRSDQELLDRLSHAGPSVL